ncbi:transporter [Muricauda sp. 334s03]|uniref:Transporter n=1 Tax=Flagellimonas yonaguniensis TaxID=3031325 RepID=A0ABT5XYY2_9FLAO|nr:transporter [[Muricauda] yonaguniensis]MDF0716403.1 transporter [[Muricauda] yonaguniensis]
MKTLIISVSLFMTGIYMLKANEMPTKPSCQTTSATLMLFDDFCDVCGCSGNGGSMGFGTGLNNNFIGLRYISQRYRSRDGIFANSPWIDENFNTVQLWTQLPIGKRFMVNAVLPYQFHSRDFADNSEQHINGLGDATVLGFYQILKQTPDSIKSIKPQHTLQLGGGVKMPTGRFDEENLEGSVNPSFQLGTGSWDYLLAVNYGANHRNWGMSLMANYTLKSKNDKEYRFGNQFNYAISTYKTYYFGNDFALTPQIGLGGEYFKKNEEYGLKVHDTGGNAFFGKAGVEVNYRSLALGVSTMLPISQDLNGGKVEAKSRISVYMNINI